MAAKFRDLNDDSDIDPPPPLADGEISSFCRNWSLVCDQKLLSGLRAFSESIVQQTDQINSQVTDLIYDGQRKCLKVMNVVNDLQMLPNSQFIENRVYEEPDAEVEVIEPEHSSVRQVVDVMPKITESLNRGLKFIDSSFPHLTRPPDPLPDESDDDDLQLKEQVIATIKNNSISSLSLPAIIGSDNFNESFYEVIKKVTSSSPAVPVDYDFVDSMPRAFETVVEAQEVDDSAEYDSDKESRVLQDMLDSDSDEDFKPIPSNDLLNIFNQSSQLVTASTPVDVEDAKIKSVKPDLSQEFSDSEEDQRDIFSQPSVNPTISTESAPKALSFKAELERKLGLKPTHIKTPEKPEINVQSNIKSAEQMNGQIEYEEKSSFKSNAQTVRSTTLFESDDSDDEEGFDDLFKRVAPGEQEKDRVAKETQLKDAHKSINHVDHGNNTTGMEEKKLQQNSQEFNKINLSRQLENVSKKQVEEKIKSNRNANERGNEGNNIGKSSRGLFSPSSSTEEEDEVPRPSFSPPSTKASSSTSSSFLPSFHKQSVVSERNSINRSSLDQLQPVKQTPTTTTSLSATSRPTSSSSSSSSVSNTIVSASKPKQKDSKKFTKKKASLFDESSSSDDDEDDLFKPKARLTLGNNKPSSSSNKHSIVGKGTTIEPVAKNKKHPVTEEKEMGGLVSSLFGPDNSHQPAIFHVNNSHDIPSSLESSSAKNKSEGKVIKTKKIERLFEDEDDYDPLFVSDRSTKQTTATQTSLLEKVNSLQETDNISSIKPTKAKIPLSPRVGNLANVTHSVSSSSVKEDSKRDELTTNSNSEGLMIPSSDPLLILEPASSSSSDEIISKSPSFIKEDSESNDDTIMDQKIAKISNLIGNKKPPPIGGVSMFGPSGVVRPEDLKVPQLRKTKPETSIKSPSSSEEDLKISKKPEQTIQRRPSSSSESKVTPLHIDASGMPRPDSIATLGNQAVKTRPKTMGRRPPTRKTLAPTASLSNGEDSESSSTSKSVKDEIKSARNTQDELSHRLEKTEQSDEEDLFKKRVQTDSVSKLSLEQDKKPSLFDESTSSESELVEQKSVISHVEQVHKESKGINQKDEGSVKDLVVVKGPTIEPSKSLTEAKSGKSENKTKSKGIFDDDSDDDEDLFAGKK